MISMCSPSPRESSCVGKSVPGATVLRSGAFKRWIGHKGSALVNGLRPLSRGLVLDTRLSSGPSLSVSIKSSCPTTFYHPSMQEESPCETQAPLSWTSQLPSRLSEINLCSSYIPQAQVFCYSSAKQRQMATLPRPITRLFCRNRQADLKIHTEVQGTWLPKTISKKNRVGGLTLPDFQIYYKTTRYWHRIHRQINGRELTGQKSTLPFMANDFFFQECGNNSMGRRTVFFF